MLASIGRFIGRSLVLGIAGLFFATGVPARASCSRSEMDVRTSVRSDPVTIREDYTALELSRQAGETTQIPPHPVIGFYAAGIGYQVAVHEGKSGQCDRFEVEVRLVETRRLIEIAKDLEHEPCRRRAAIKHYKHHEAVQTAALVDSSHRLQGALHSFLAEHEAVTRSAVDLLVSQFMTKWLDDYEAEMPAMRGAADTPSEVSALVHACDT